MIMVPMDCTTCEFEKDCTKEKIICPQWQPGKDSFAGKYMTREEYENWRKGE